MTIENAIRVAMLVGMQPSAVVLAFGADQAGTAQLKTIWKANTRAQPSIASRMVFVKVPTKRAAPARSAAERPAPRSTKKRR